MRFSPIVFAAVMTLFSRAPAGPAPATQPYKLIDVTKVGGPGGWDYVYADSSARRLYIPRTGAGADAGRVTVYDLDTLQPAGEIPNTKGVHGVAVDPKTGHGFISAGPVVMFDAKTLATIKTIDVKGRPDGILFDPATNRVLVLSHQTPNVTLLDPADGSILGTIDLGGEPEQAVSDGAGHVYIAIEDGDNIAAVDVNAMKVTAHYPLAGKGGGPAGLAIDPKNHILFAFCHDPHTAVIMNADTGKIITTLPIGDGVDAGGFNPATSQAFSSQRDGTLTIIKENSPTDFSVEQTVQTKPGARTSTLDTKTNRIYLITADPDPSAHPAPESHHAPMLPNSFMILTVGH